MFPTQHIQLTSPNTEHTQHLQFTSPNTEHTQHIEISSPNTEHVLRLFILEHHNIRRFGHTVDCLLYSRHNQEREFHLLSTGFGTAVGVLEFGACAETIAVVVYALVMTSNIAGLGENDRKHNKLDLITMSALPPPLLWRSLPGFKSSTDVIDSMNKEKSVDARALVCTHPESTSSLTAIQSESPTPRAQLRA
jgi:hypothetical protein